MYNVDEIVYTVYINKSVAFYIDVLRKTGMLCEMVLIPWNDGIMCSV